MAWAEGIPAEMTDSEQDAASETALELLEFVEKRRERVYRIARRMSSSHEAADDIVQEAFLRAFRSLRRFRRNSSVETWLTRIVINVAISHSRKEKRFTQFLDRFRAQSCPREPETPLERLEAMEAREQVQAAVAALPAGQRAVIVLTELEGMSCVKAAEILNIPVGTVRSRRHHAREKLRRRLAPYALGKQWKGSS